VLLKAAYSVPLQASDSKIEVFAFHTLSLVWGRRDEKEGFTSKQLQRSSGWLLSPASSF